MPTSTSTYFPGVGKKELGERSSTEQVTLKAFDAQQESPHECLISTLHTLTDQGDQDISFGK